MCTIPSLFSSATSVITTVMPTLFSLTNMSKQNKLTEYQIEQERKNAKNAELEAAYARQEGVEEARRQKLNSILNMGNERVKFAQGNVALSSETVLNLEDDLRLNTEIDALTTQQKSERKAQSLLDKRDSLYANAELKSFNSKLNSFENLVNLGQNAFSLGTKAINTLQKR